jgi:hypothetical protein
VARRSLVYLVFNTISNLTTQDAQCACFANAAARHLEPGGCFVSRSAFPTARRFERLRPSDTHVGVETRRRHRSGALSHHFTLVDGEWGALDPPCPLDSCRG